MNKQEENALIPEAAAPKGVIQSAKDFVNGVLSPLVQIMSAVIASLYVEGRTFIGAAIHLSRYELIVFQI